MALVLLVTLASVGFNALTTPPVTLPAPSGADITVDGIRAHYQRWGTQGSPLVLIHGFAESTVAWEPAARLLARDHVVYAVDLAGYGYTEYTGHYALTDQVALVDGFVRALDLDRPVLVGHSMGAAVVGGVALQHPGDVGGIVFVDGDGLPFSNSSGGGSGTAGTDGSGGNGSAGVGGRLPTGIIRSPYLISAYRLVTRSSWWGDRLIQAQCGSPCRGLTPELAEEWLRPLQQGAAEAALPRMASDGVLHLAPEQLRAITVPRAVIWGERDLRSGGSLADARSNFGDPPTLVIPGAGHLSMVADPDTFTADLEQLVATMPAAR